MFIKYFGYGSNKDLDMMAHMVGRPDLKGEPGKLLDYELCVQKLDQIRDGNPVSPREIVRNGFGNNFELFIARPKKGAEIPGTIWNLTEPELELVKNWEMVELGMQEEVNARALDSKGNIISVETQAVVEPPALFDRIITGPDYEPYIVDKAKMLSVADFVRNDYLKPKTV
jgi:hypothetical protein